MRRHRQTLEDILGRLSPLEVDWQDDTAKRVVERLRAFPLKPTYTEDDIKAVLADGVFDDSALILRTFLGLSKDQFTARLSEELGPGGTGVMRMNADPEAFVAALVRLGALEAIAAATSRELHWTDVLVERLRSGRGSAISGQRRGRGLEQFVEEIVGRVFGENFETNCNFRGVRGEEAKCDIAVPSINDPDLVIETKGYGATGSKMTDILGDIRKIFEVKRPDTYFLIFTDGITWRSRQSDLAKIVDFQNNGKVYRVYTTQDAAEFEQDLIAIKAERNL